MIHRETCRACGADLIDVWQLGVQTIVGFPLAGDRRPLEAPLTLALCRAAACSLLQLRDTVPPEALFRKYWYRSGTNEAMVRVLASVVAAARARQPVGATDVVLDIGANDGTLLAQYDTDPRTCPPRVCPIRIAYDPADDVQESLARHCDVRIHGFFPDELAAETRGVKIVTAIAMAYDLEDPKAFFAGVRDVLHPEGLFVLQVGYLPAMLAANAFDAICHEHLEYYSLTSLQAILTAVDLAVEDVEENDTNGGSIRVFIRKAAVAQPSRRVMNMLTGEALAGLQTVLPYVWMKARVERIRTKLWEILDRELRLGGAVDVYGASTKGLTLLQYFGLDAVRIRWAVDRNPIKWDRYYGGTGIPIVPEETWRQDPRGMKALVLPWHFREGILEREKEWLKRPGRAFVFPLPHKPEVIYGS